MTTKEDQSWMLAEVVAVPYVRHAVVLSADGLAMVWSEHTDPDVADRLSAACSGLQSLGRSVGKEFGSAARSLRHLMIEFDGGYLFVRRAGDGSHLAVVTEAAVDPALIAHQMQTQVNKIGERNLAANARQGTKA